MSRRSLRLDDGLLDRSLPHSSASFSVGGAGWRSSSLLKCRGSRQLSRSCSESLLVDTPRRLRSSDASLLSSLVEDSSIHENTLVDSFWGLDHDTDPKESTIIADQSTVLTDRTLIGPDECEARRPVQAVGRFYCQDCEPSTKEPACPPSITPPTTTTTTTSPSSRSGGPEVSTIYSRARKRKTHQDGLQLWWDWCVASVRRAAACCLLLLSHTWQVCQERLKVPEGAAAAPAGHSGIMNLKESRRNQELHPGGALREAAARVLGWISRRRPCVTSDLLTWPALVVLPLLLLLFSVCWFAPAVLQTLLHADLAPSLSQSEEGAAADSGGAEPGLDGEAPTDEVAADEESRLARLEQSVAALWEQVVAGGQRAEQRHTEVMKLYEEVSQGGGGGGRVGVAWLSGLMEQQLRQERRRAQRLRGGGASRLEQLELQLQALVARTEELQSKQEVFSACAAPQPRDDVLAEVARLEAALEDVGRVIGGMSDCRQGCRRLDGIQDAISSQIRDEVQTLVYGGSAAGADATGNAPSESLLQWLERRCVGEAELQAALAALERSVLRNITAQLEGGGGGGGGVSREDVQVMVANALRRFSEDRTGMADFALESGGGSVISCSETYRTGAALLSLFGFPLWYFSQSPRAAIQPDILPGNCWAFRGSTGFLVIRLSAPIFPTAVTVEHTPRALAPSGDARSAPRDFSVYGLDEETQGRGQLLGAYTYERDGDAVQTFTISEACDRPFQLVEVRVASNWGQPEYTCLYRVRVHGTPFSEAPWSSAP